MPTTAIALRPVLTLLELTLPILTMALTTSGTMMATWRAQCAAATTSLLCTTSLLTMALLTMTTRSLRPCTVKDAALCIQAIALCIQAIALASRCDLPTSSRYSRCSRAEVTGGLRAARRVQVDGKPVGKKRRWCGGCAAYHKGAVDRYPRCATGRSRGSANTTLLLLSPGATGFDS